MIFGRTLLVGLFAFCLVQGNSLHARVLRETTAVTCFQGHSEKVRLRSTDRLPDAVGEAKVERRGGTTEVGAEMSGMKPASLFGGDYNTYVLWVVSPEGRIVNLGELLLDGDRGTLQASTSLATFAMFVTAEPHYLVSAPSVFVVLENKPDAKNRTIQYPVLQGIYNFERSTLDDVKQAKGKVHSEVKQAFTAVRLAQRARAGELAKSELIEAQRALDQTLDLLHRGIDRQEIVAQARETVRLAVAAQRLAEDRALLDARVIREGSGGGSGDTGGHDPRGQ